MFGTCADTNRVRVYGDAVSVARKPGSLHRVAASTVMVLDPLSVMTGGVVSVHTRLVDVPTPLRAGLHAVVSVNPRWHVGWQALQKGEPGVNHWLLQQFADAGRFSLSENGPGQLRPPQYGDGLLHDRVRDREPA